MNNSKSVKVSDLHGGEVTVSGATIIRTWRGVRTPANKVEVEYKDRRGNYRRDQWNRNTLVSII